MKLDPKPVFAQLAAWISSGRRARRRPLQSSLPAPSDFVLESRLMLTSPGGMMNVPPQLTGAPLISFNDTVVNGDVVGQAYATDADGDAITFSFGGGSPTDPSGTFLINGGTGVITVANAANIGSQDGTMGSPTGWSFAATIVASDGPASPTDASQAVSFLVEKSPFTIVSPEPNQVFRAMTDKFVFKGTRAKGVDVKVEILKKNAAGDYVKITNQNFTAEKIISGAGGQTKAEFDFGVAEIGEYLVKYKFRQTTFGTNGFTDTGESAYFKMVAP